MSDTGLTGLPDYVVQSSDIAPPDTPTDLPRDHITKYYRDAYNELRKMGVPGFAAAIVAGLLAAPSCWIVVGKDVLLIVLKVLLPSWGATVLDALDDMRKALDPEFGNLAVGVLNELLGTDLAVTSMPLGIGEGDHLARAKTLGALLHDQLTKQFLPSGPVTADSGAAAAETFTGLMINFGTATGIMGLIGGLVPVIHLDEIREVGEMVAQNLGLGRLGRQALRPLIQATVEEPYKWKIYSQARPTLLSAADLVNPYTSQVIDPTLVHDQLSRQGYADNLISALIELHQKKLAETDYFTLVAMGLKTQDDAIAYMQKLGYSLADAQLRYDVEYLRHEHAAQQLLIGAAMQAYELGHIQRDELLGLVKVAYPLENEQGLIMLAADYKRRTPSKHLTLAEITDMLDKNVISLDEFENYLTTWGYSADDALNLKIWTLEKLQAKDAAAAAKAAKTAAKGSSTSGTTTSTTGS